MVDVKLTETDLPWWFDVLGDVDFINAHARVEFHEITTLSGAMPFGVPDVKPNAAKAIFIDEDTGQPIAERALTRRSYTGGIATWDTLDAPPLDVTLEQGGPTNIGVRVVLSGSTSTTCGQPLVECYDRGSPNGILHARAWSPDPATPTAPKARHVGLLPAPQNGCSDAHFTVAPAAGCNVHMVAQIDLGGGLPEDYSMDATVANKKYALRYDVTNGLWVSNQPIPIPPASAPVQIGIEWKSGKNTGNLGMVQRTFSASNARSGPIKEAALWADGQRGVSSFERCSATHLDCTYRLSVEVGIQGSFEDFYRDLQNVRDPVTLRLAGGESGSQNQALDCDPWNEDPGLGGGTRGFVDEIAHGCRPAYAINTGDTCPGSPNDLWGTSTSKDDQGDPWQCVAVETGDRVSQVGTGLNLRILGDQNPDTCTNPNNWDEVKQAPDPASVGDPRIIHLFLTQFGAFALSGQNTVPVTNFATFYVTGWKGQGGHTSPCANPPPPADPNDPPIRPDDPVTESGTVVGHFMKYRGPLGDNTGTESCDFDGPTPCVFALTE
jgi:hypothetical protein